MSAVPYRSGDFPNIIVIGPKWRESYFLDGFMPFANVFYVQQDTFSNFFGALKRSLLTSYLYRSPTLLKKLIVRFSTMKVPINEYSKWRWQPKYLKETGIDGIIVVPHSIPPKRSNKYLANTKVYLMTMDIESERFYQAYCWIAKLGLVDRVYLTHRTLIKKFEPCITNGVKVDVLPYYFSPLLFNPYPLVKPLMKPVFIGSLTGQRKVFVEYLNNVLKKKIGTTLKTFQAASRDYSFLIKKYFINVDIPRKQEVNFRVFEVTGSGGLLITGSYPNVLDFFKSDGQEIYTYNLINLNKLNEYTNYKKELESSATQIANIIQYLLENLDEAVKTAYRGCIKAWKKHTIYHRACKIVEDLGFKCDKSFLKLIENTGENICRHILNLLEDL